MVKNKPSSIKLKLAILFIIVGLVPPIVVGAYTICKQTQLVKQKAVQTQERVLAQKLNTVDLYLQDGQNDLHEISARFSVQTFVDELIKTSVEEKRDFWTNLVQQDLSRLGETRKRYAQIQLIDLYGQERVRVDYVHNKSVIQPKSKLQNVASTPYLTQALSLETDELMVLPIFGGNSTTVTTDNTTPLIRLCKLLYSSQRRKAGVLVLTIHIHRLLHSFGEVPVGSTMLIDKTGRLLYHSDFETSENGAISQMEQTFQTGYFKEILSETGEKQRGTIIDWNDHVLSFQTFTYAQGHPNAQWLGVYSLNTRSAEWAEVLTPINDFRGTVISIIALSFLITLAAALVFAHKLTNNLLSVVEMAKAVSVGDLRPKKLHRQSDDEVGMLARNVDTMVARLRKNILSLTKTATDISSSSTELSSTVNEQSAITAQQSASLTEITATLEELTTSSSQIADNSNSVVKIAAAALSESEKGMADIEMIKEKMDQIAHDNKSSTDEIIELGKKSKEVGKVMEIITNIADQTKLIAFNAAIEASSAGDAGRRFEVVATEIRRLADSVMSSTEEIEHTIEEIQRAINRLVIASEKGANRINEGTSLAAETLSQLESLVSGAKSTSDASTQISLSTQQQKSATNQVLNALKEIEQGFMEIAASIQQTSDISTQLSGSSTTLKDLVTEYQVDSEKIS